MDRILFQRHADRSACLRQLAADLAGQLQRVLAEQAEATLLLPGGSSPQALLPLLAESALPWERVVLSPTDERWVAAEDPRSNTRLLRQGLPAAVCLNSLQGATPQQAADQWLEQLAGRTPFAAVLLGMGEDGHIASLFPDMPGLAEALDPQAPPATLVGRAPVEPCSRLSANLSLLLNSRWLGLLAFGERKRELLEAALADQPDSRPWPVHALLYQSSTTLMLYWAP